MQITVLARALLPQLLVQARVDLQVDLSFTQQDQSCSWKDLLLIPAHRGTKCDARSSSKLLPHETIQVHGRALTCIVY